MAYEIDILRGGIPRQPFDGGGVGSVGAGKGARCRAVDSGLQGNLRG